LDLALSIIHYPLSITHSSFSIKNMAILKKQAEAILPTDWGDFRMLAYARRSDDNLPHLAMVADGFSVDNQPITVRIHSECMTGDVFHSHRCDCGEQLDFAMQTAAEQGGVVIYLRQEGRGIGLINKLKAYNLQDKGWNTLEANIKLGFGADERQYDDAATILHDLGIQKIRLMTNNPLKINALEKMGFTVIERVPVVIEPKAENAFYLETKRRKMGHLD
jgi:GTP cyclohydrolase II